MHRSFHFPLTIPARPACGPTKVFQELRTAQLGPLPSADVTTCSSCSWGRSRPDQHAVCAQHSLTCSSTPGARIAMPSPPRASFRPDGRTARPVDLQPRPPAGRGGSQRMCPSRTRLRPRLAGLSSGLHHSLCQRCARGKTRKPDAPGGVSDLVPQLKTWIGRPPTSHSLRPSCGPARHP